MVIDPRILLINLKSRKERLFKAQEELKSSIILNKHEVIYGIDGSKLSDNQIEPYITDLAYSEIKCNKKTNGLYLTKGAVGLALTYKNILEQATRNTLVLEDDIKIDSSFDVMFENTIKNLPTNWDILYLGWHPSKHLKISSISSNINSISGQINGTHGWMFNYKSKQKLLKVFPLRYQIDTELYRLSNLNRYCTIYPLITTVSSQSDIQN